MRIFRICLGVFLLILAVLIMLTSFITLKGISESVNFQMRIQKLFCSLILITISLKLLSKPGKTTVDSDGAVYAGFGLRAPALIIDGIILNGLYFLILPLQSYSFALYAVSTYLFPVLVVAYNIFFLVKFGATPGKLAMKIKVVKTSFGPISFKEAFLRLSVNILFIVFSLIAITTAFKSFSYETYRIMSFLEKGKYIFSFYPNWFNYHLPLNLLWFWGEITAFLFNRKRRALHDFIAGTVVIIRPDAYQKHGFKQSENAEEPKGKMGFHA